MKARVLSEEEHAMVQRGLMRLPDKGASELYGKLLSTTGKRLVLLDLTDERLDQSDEVGA